MENIQISYPGYFLLLIGVIALIYAFGLYFRDRRIKENKKWLPTVLAILRFFAALALLFLLLSPLFKQFNEEIQKPLIVIAKDKSNSVPASTDSSTLTSVNNKIASIAEMLKEDFEVIEFDFAENMSFDGRDSLNSESTNISGALEYISESYEDQNLGSVILATDGIFNEGKNPIYSDLQFTAPLHIIALGDTTIRTDLLIKNVLHNRIVYLNDRFLIEADVQAYDAAGSRCEIRLFGNINGARKLIKSESFTIDNNNYFKSFQFEMEATQVGNIKYEIELTRLNSESNFINNKRNIYIETLDARQKILLLAANTHPDIKAIKSAINSSKNYEIDIIKAGEPLGGINQYDVIILHNLPNQSRDFDSVIQMIKKQKIPCLYIVGAGTSIRDFNDAQNVLNVIGNNSSLNDATAQLEHNFKLFTLDDDLKNNIERFVPLKAPFGEFILDDNTQVLLNQKIGTVETRYPLLAYNAVNNHKQAVLLGEGLWRWRLYEYLEFENHDYTQSLLIKTIQYISQKEDKRQFRAYANKNAFKENEAIIFDAQLYNANYEPINDPESFLTVTNQDGDKFNYTFSKSSNYYILDAGRFPEGNYNFLATTTYNGKKLEAAGRFAVQSIVKEQYDLTARHDILFMLAQKFGGNVIYPESMDSIPILIQQNEAIKPIVYQKASSEPLLNFQWYLMFIIVLLAIEWFLRRYFGNY